MIRIKTENGDITIGFEGTLNVVHAEAAAIIAALLSELNIGMIRNNLPESAIEQEFSQMFAHSYYLYGDMLSKKKAKLEEESNKNVISGINFQHIPKS